MAKLNFAQGFELTLDSGEKKQFRIGLQTVPDELAAHWFVQAHVAPDEEEGEQDDEDEDRKVLVEMAKELGINVGKRWGNKKIEDAIEAAEAKKKAENGGA